MATAPKPQRLAFPKTIGAAIDLLYTLREKRIEEEKKVKLLKDQETALRLHIMTNFDTSKVEGARGKLASASFTEVTNADITDWPAYVRWCVKNKAFTGVQQRVGITTLREYWENGKKPDGVTPVVVKDLSITKAAKK